MEAKAAKMVAPKHAKEWSIASYSEWVVCNVHVRVCLCDLQPNLLSVVFFSFFFFPLTLLLHQTGNNRRGEEHEAKLSFLASHYKVSEY